MVVEQRYLAENIACPTQEPLNLKAYSIGLSATEGARASRSPG